MPFFMSLSSRLSMTCESDPKFLLDALGLFDQHLQDAVLGPLRVEEVVAIDVGVGLEFAVDAAVALLHTPGVPGNVEMEKVPAMGLQVEALSRGIGGDQNPQRMLFGIGIEGFFDCSRSAAGVGP